MRLCRSVPVMSRGAGRGCKGRGAVGLKPSEEYMASGKRSGQNDFIM